ncbi:MAG TPA: PIG-L deacetylase family protein [Burkholderiales bacterium]|nr:PIG-L deacetylase family protein [Burkholderiales bacterium]
MTSLAERYAGRTVLAVGAHADDIELAVGGTMARLRRAGARVVMLVVSLPGEHKVRRREAQEAAKILGCELRVLMDDARRIEDMKSYELVARIDREVRELEPAAMLTHGASEFHRDHVLVHQACVSSQRLRYFDFFTYQPNFCRPVPIAFHPRVYVDITDSIDTKMRAIEAHESQFKCRGLGTEMYRDIARMNGRMVGVKYAEGLDVARMLLA